MTEWTPLPELPPPAGVEACSRCQLSRQRSRVVWAEGNPSAPVMVVLDNPGARDDPTGSPFVCGTRQTLRACAQEAGLQERDLYVTWVLKCRPVRTYAKEEARAACLPYLQQQMREMGARVIVLMGNVALQAVLGGEGQEPGGPDEAGQEPGEASVNGPGAPGRGDAAPEVKALRGTVLSVGGRPAVCTYHPLAALRRPNLRPLLVADLRLAVALLS